MAKDFTKFAANANATGLGPHLENHYLKLLTEEPESYLPMSKNFNSQVSYYLQPMWRNKSLRIVEG